MGGHGPPLTGSPVKCAGIGGPLKKVFAYMGPYKKALVAGILLAVISALLALIGPQYLGEMTDTISQGIGAGKTLDIGKVERIGVILVVLYSVSAVLSTIENYLLPVVSQKVVNTVRRELERKMDRLPIKYFDGTTTGDMMSRLTNDADTVGESFSESISQIVTALTLLLGSAAMMFLTCWKLAVVSVIPALVAMCFMYLMVTRSQKFFGQQQTDLGKMNGHVEETYYAMDIVRAYNGQKRSAETFETINGSLHRTSFLARVLSGIIPRIMEFLDNLSYVIVCVVGSYMIIKGEISYGVIVAFIVYVRHFTVPVAQLANAVVSLQSVAAASERVFDILEAEEMEKDTDKIKLAHVSGAVEFRDVRFSYEKGREIIHGFSETVSPGQRVAIVGPTGTGKTTLVNLLMRFYEIDSGDILIDGVSIRDIARSELRSAFSMVLQDSWIFEGTVKENVAFADGDVSEAKIVKACEDVGIDAFVRSLPDGYDTVLKPYVLSMGQRQQFSIARAIVRNAPMLILDEATSSVDTRTEKKIQDALDTLMEGKTSFVIAHRLTTILNADKILVMKDGSIIEQGTHEELLRMNGFYNELYRSQFADCRRSPAVSDPPFHGHGPRAVGGTTYTPSGRR